MAVQKIDIEQFLALAKEYPVLDVRSPGEYWPGLFWSEDEEDG